ncbi:probable disease resistance protein RPP1 [Pyrus x bretschneideri]|uniref:probable disease resistance protein RPP1 n=1 Tax=Pyrus x bretschneideri TaxID=225117 RepID=UPI00202F0B5A|nr:probable disease resistance protein RPP1 [Pyrus x bretschneideri]
MTASLDPPDSLHYLYWLGYPLVSLLSIFCPGNLVELHIQFSRVKKLWKKEQRLVNLQVIDMSYSLYVIEVPNLSGSLKIVNINLNGCFSLVEIPSYFQHLHKLTCLELGYCMTLKYLLEMSENIQYLELQDTDLEKLPSNNCELKVSNVLGIASCTSLDEFSELPRDITKLSLVGFKRLVSLPTHICKLKYLEKLDLSSCSELENFPEILEPMEHLKSLNLSATVVEELPSSIEFLPALKRIPTTRSISARRKYALKRSKSPDWPCADAIATVGLRFAEDQTMESIESATRSGCHTLEERREESEYHEFKG